MDLGFSIVDIDPLAAMPMFPKNAERTHSEIVALGRTKDPNPNGADTSVVTDLYAFAAYLEGEPENAALYRSKTTAELLGLFDSHAKRFAMRNDDLGKLCASLSTAAKTYVFNSDENRQAYENFLKYKSPSLTALFESMQGASKADLLDAKFAEPCIKRISEVFGNYDTALAIYNREAGLKDEPYVPLKPVYHIKCEYCGQVSEFPSEEEAQRANQCTNCKKELFKKCSKCGKLIPVSRDKCPHCGFFFAGALLFEKHYRTAEDALRKSNFEAARKHLYDAQSADPGESRRVEQLLSKIETEEKKYAQPINKLRELIAGKKFAAARQVLYETIKQYPGLNVSANGRPTNALRSCATMSTTSRHWTSSARTRPSRASRSPSRRMPTAFPSAGAIRARWAYPIVWNVQRRTKVANPGYCRTGAFRHRMWTSRLSRVSSILTRYTPSGPG